MPSIEIIGGSDGPTAVFLTSDGPQWVNWPGAIFVLLLLLPNLLYLFKRPRQAPSKNKILEILEQLSRYSCMLLMILGPSIRRIGFVTPFGLVVYLFGNLALVLAYWVCWGFFFQRERRALALAMALLPACIFLLSGILLHDPALALAALLFGIAHISITLSQTFGS